MNAREKKEILNNLREREFRQELIIPLLSKMGYLAPIEYHGSNEKGKDIICFEYDRLGEQRFLAVVAKTGDLTGNASTTAGLMTIVNQVQQAFDNPYEDLYNMRQVFINEVWIVTNGKIVSGAQESVINTLRKNNLDKQIRIIGDDRLVQLIDKHFSTYWNSSLETKESVIIQRDRVIAFIENLLFANNVDKSTVESVKSAILYSPYTPRITKDIEGLHISSVSSFSVELAKIDSAFDDFIVSKIYGITSQKFQEAKKHLRYSFFDIEETIDHANKIIKLTNPSEFVSESMDNLSQDYPFYNRSGRADDFMDDLRYLEEGLNELKYFKAFLKSKNKLDWAKTLSKSIVDLLPEVEKIIENSKEDDLFFSYTIREDKAVCIEYDRNNVDICFSLQYRRIEIKGWQRNKDGSLKASKVIEQTLFKFREYVEDKLSYDEETWHDEYNND